jgi:ankyrin repeat protein
MFHWRGFRDAQSAGSANAALMQAAEDGSCADVTAALDFGGADANAKAPGNGWTPLMQAAASGNDECCKLLIARGADVNAATTFHWTPLMFASLAGHNATARSLIGAGADVNYATPQGITPLMVATREGAGGICEDLIAAGARIDVCDSFGRSLLHFAADCPDDVNGPATIRALLSRGLSVNACDETGQTPLMEAAIGGNLGVIDALLRHGADPLARNDAGHTARDLALQNSNEAAVERLTPGCEARANLN